MWRPTGEIWGALLEGRQGTPSRRTIDIVYHMAFVYHIVFHIAFGSMTVSIT